MTENYESPEGQQAENGQDIPGKVEKWVGFMKTFTDMSAAIRALRPDGPRPNAETRDARIVQLQAFTNTKPLKEIIARTTEADWKRSPDYYVFLLERFLALEKKELEKMERESHA